MSVKLASVGALFRSGGFELSKAWSPVDLDKLTDEQIETLCKRYGRWIRAYPSDRAEVEAYIAEHTPAQTSIGTATATKAPKATSKAAKAAGKDG